MKSLPAIPTNLCIPFTNNEKQKIKFVAIKIGLRNCSSYIRMKILADVNQFLADYKLEREKIKQKEVMYAEAGEM